MHFFHFFGFLVCTSEERYARTTPEKAMFLDFWEKRGKKKRDPKVPLYINESEVSDLHSIVNNHLVPKVGAVLDEFLMDRVILVNLLSFEVVEEHQFRCAVA
jgi:hypothetical protein